MGCGLARKHNLPPVIKHISGFDGLVTSLLYVIPDPGSASGTGIDPESLTYGYQQIPAFETVS
jgi:hypothetical protein